MKTTAPLALACCLFLTGCESFPTFSNRRIKDLDKQIATINSQITTNNQQLESVQRGMEKVQQSLAENSSQKAQGAANAVFLASEGNRANPNGNHYTAFVGGQLGAASAFLPGPDARAQLDAPRLVTLIPSDRPEDIAQLKHDLEERKQAALALQLTNDALRVQFGGLAQERQQLATDRDQLKDDRDKIRGQKEGVQNELLAKAAALNERLEHNKALKAKIVWLFTIAAIVCGIGAAGGGGGFFLGAFSARGGGGGGWFCAS